MTPKMAHVGQQLVSHGSIWVLVGDFVVVVLRIQVEGSLAGPWFTGGER